MSEENRDWKSCAGAHDFARSRSEWDRFSIRPLYNLGYATRIHPDEIDVGLECR